MYPQEQSGPGWASASGRHKLSSTETLETTPNPEATPAGDIETAHAPALDAEQHEEHSHEGPEHHHHGPTLNPECTREVAIDIPADEVTRNFRSVTKRYQKMARIPGFRAGKVPESLIRTRFAEQIRQDVTEAILPEHFRKAIAEQALKPISQPQVTNIHLVDGEPLHFKAIFEVLPEFSIDGYQDIKVEKPEVALTEAEFEEELSRVRDSRATMEPVTEERALADGDWAEIDFRGENTSADADVEAAVDAQPVEGKGVLIEVGGANTLAAFNEALRGATPGQELKFEVQYPADFGEKRLAGHTVTYDVEVKAIKKKIQPEMNDDFAKELGEYESMDEFRSKLREHLESDKRRRLEATTKDALIEALVQHFQFPVPESLVQQQVDARLDRGLRALAAQGMKAEDMRKLDFDRLRVAQRDSAVAEVKGIVILDKIAEAEHTEVTDEEVEQQLQRISAQAREPLETLRARLTEDGGLARIREQLLREKTGAVLYERLGS